MHIIGFNGPPGSGKDELALAVMQIIEARSDVPVKLESLSMPLRRVSYAVVDDKGELDGDDYAQFKTQEFDELGVNGRQLMIDVSEKFLKPIYGIDVMARLLIERNARFNGILLVRDSGFQIEVDPLAAWVGAANLFIARCHRPGKTFEGDSREWVTHPDGLMELDLQNDSHLFDWTNHAAHELVATIRHRTDWKI